MSMVIKNNPTALMALNTAVKNSNSAAKDLKKLSSGVKIAGAGDDASGYAISEKMRVRIRALYQNEENVVTGSRMLGVATAGIQGQIDLIRRAKEKVIDAANDHNNEDDRATIQKELSQMFEEMSDLAVETDYNTHRVLWGSQYWQTVNTWQDLTEYDNTVWSDVKINKGINENSDLTGVNPIQGQGVIPDKFDTLDDVKGPFDVFKRPQSIPTDLPAFGTTVTATPQNFSGGLDGQPSTVTMDLSMYTSVAELDNVGFQIEGVNFLLTTDPSRLYNESVDTFTNHFNKIDISGCSTVEDVAQKIAQAISGKTYYVSGTYDTMKQLGSATASGKTVTYTTTENNNAEQSNSVLFKSSPTGSSYSTTKIIDQKPKLDQIDIVGTSTGIFGAATYLKGGKAGYSGLGLVDAGPGQPGVKATLSANISGVPNNSGIEIHGSYVGKIMFVEGNSGFTLANPSSAGIYTVGKNANANISMAGMQVSISGGVITFTASKEGKYGNDYYVKDGCEFHQYAQEYDPGKKKTFDYAGIKAIDTSLVSNSHTGTDGTYAHYSIDLSAWTNNTDLNDLENLIDDLYRKNIGHTGAYFGDSSILGTGMEGLNVDLNSLYAAVENGETIGNALAKMISATAPNSTITLDGNGNATEVVLQAYNIGSIGNNETVEGYENTLRSYDIDFGAYFANNPGFVFPDDLVGDHGKGFRVYCATCADQWFNFEFVNFQGLPEDWRQGSGTDTDDIRSIMIDVSQVTDASSLVEAIYMQAMPILTGEGPAPYFKDQGDYDHFIRMGADLKDGILTVYDNRPASLEPYMRNEIPVYDDEGDIVPNEKWYPNAQREGAKIADGFTDNIIWDHRKIYQNEVHIQDTDKGSQYTKVTIPRMSLDQVFGYNPSYFEISDFHILTKKNRYLLIGTDEKQGFFDKGLTYLLDAQTIIGSQMSRLGYDADNIVTARENTTSAESTIRDADMAREAMNYARDNILAQSAQSMLAQANQNASNVLSLLQ